MKRLLTGLFLMLGSLALPAAAQTPAGASAPAAAAQAAPSAARSKFQASDELEALRYRHLWIAYGIIWLSIFGFVWGTWKRSRRTEAALDELRAKLAELEREDG